MRAVISTVDYDPAGWVLLDVLPESAQDSRRRRMNRVATLDGGAAVNDFGFVEADRTFVLRWTPRERDTDDAIDRLVRLYSRLRLSIDGALYLVAPEVYTPGADESTLTLLVVERLTT